MCGELSLPGTYCFSLLPTLWTHYQQLHGMRNAARGMVFGLKSTGANWLTAAPLVERFDILLHLQRLHQEQGRPVKPQLQPELYPITGGVSRCHSVCR